jgi:Fe-S-cluster containining protein
MTAINKGERDFFIVLKEEARTAIWQVGSNADPESLIKNVLEDLEALAPRKDGQDNRSDDEIWGQIRERLIKAAYATRPYCIRCGKCCTTGSPTLLSEDISLFTRNILKPSDVFTIRQGETVYSNQEDRLSYAEQELIKIKEIPGSKTCVFFRTGDKSCSIYDARPLQCRHQECWNPDRSPAISDTSTLHRESLLGDTGPLWDIIQRHELRCSPAEFSRVMARLSATKGHAVEELLDLLRFDHHVRNFILEKFNLAPETLSFFLGRPLSEAIEHYGLQVTEQPDGSFLLTPADQTDVALEDAPR